MPFKIRSATIGALTLVAGTGLGAIVGAEFGSARDLSKIFIPLFVTGASVMDEPIVYPTGAPAKLTANILTLEPGQETGWHTHGVPIAGIVLEGEITVDYGARGVRTFRKGDAVAEAINVPHNGKNTGPGTLRVFALYMGAEGLPTGIPVKK